MVRVGSDQRWVQFGPYCADLRARELTKHGIRLKLQSRPFEILTMLLERPGDVVTREELRAQLWPDGTFVDFDSNISSAVRKLRDTLCDSAAEPRYIETVGRVGYRFIAQAEFAGKSVGPTLNNAVTKPESSQKVTEACSMSDAALAQASAVAGPALSGPVPSVSPTEERSKNNPRLYSTGFVLICMVCVAVAVLLVNFSRKRLAHVVSANGVISTSLAMRDASAEYAAGRELWSRRGEDPLKASIDHFDRAIHIQSNYGLAYSGLADAYVLLPFYSRITPAEAYPKAKAAALRAVELAPQSAEAHTSLAYAKLYADWDFRGAEEEFRIALQQNPNYFTALQWHAEYLSLIGRYDDAIREITQALEMAPDLAVMHHNAGQIYQAARRYDEAINQYGIALRLDPTFLSSNVFMALAYKRKGMYDKALELELEYEEQMGDANRLALVRRLADAYRSGGVEGYLRELLALELEENPDRDSYGIAHCYALLGDKDSAFKYLDHAYQLHQSDLLGLNGDPELDSLRSDPRFLALRRRVGLPLKDEWQVP